MSKACHLGHHGSVDWMLSPFSTLHPPFPPNFLSKLVESKYLWSLMETWTLFWCWSIICGTIARYISDKLRAYAITATSFTYAKVPSIFLYHTYSGISKVMMTAGLFVNGPYALIATAVSADLGAHSCQRGDSRATVIAIVDVLDQFVLL